MIVTELHFLPKTITSKPDLHSTLVGMIKLKSTFNVISTALGRSLQVFTAEITDLLMTFLIVE